MTGREFEDICVKELHKAGYWAHRIHPDEAGQQPFDIIAMKADTACAYDAKVVTEGTRFPLRRIEDNQLNAFRLFEKKVHNAQIGLLIYHDGVIRFLSLGNINTCLWLGQKSIPLSEIPIWRL